MNNIAFEGKTTNGTCKTDEDGGDEDAEIGRCLESVNVQAGDSRDEDGKETFFPLRPDSMLLDIPSWYWKYKYYKSKNETEHSENVSSLLPYIIFSGLRGLNDFIS